MKSKCLCLDLGFYDKNDKILIRRIINRQDRLDATYFNEKGVFKKDLNPFLVTDIKYNCLYLLGLINSKLFSWLYINSSSIAGKDDFRQTTLAELRKLPIKKLTKSTESQINKIIHSVELILRAKSQIIEARSENDKNYLESKIEALDIEIDTAIYELYEISPNDQTKIELTFTKSKT